MGARDVRKGHESRVGESVAGQPGEEGSSGRGVNKHQRSRRRNDARFVWTSNLLIFVLGLVATFFFLLQHGGAGPCFAQETANVDVGGGGRKGRREGGGGGGDWAYSSASNTVQNIEDNKKVGASVVGKGQESRVGKGVDCVNRPR